MAYTGYLIIQYIDENPNSPTYGETWTERQLDTTHCPADGGGEWELISTFCESDTSGYTGNRINTYYNSVTGEYSSTTAPDASCTASSTEENWVNSGDVYCEITEEGVYTGWGIQLQVQRNSNLLNYGKTREIRVANASCSAHTEPIWQTLSTNCHIVTDELTCYLTYDGTADLLQIDNNPSSPTFNQTRTITDESEECQCEACDRIEYEWRFVDDICGIQMPSKYGLTGLTDDTVYHVYRKYGRCIIDDQPTGRLQPMNEYSAVTYQTGVTDCIYRWVDTEETVCSNENDGKYFTTIALEDDEMFLFTPQSNYSIQYSVDGGSTWQNITSGETTPSVSAGTKVFWKGVMPSSTSGNIGSFKTRYYYGYDVEGNIMSLIFGDNFADKTDLTGYENVFNDLFYASNVKSALNLSLPATKLAVRCYQGMFAGSSLVTPPVLLPILEMAEYCCYNMFNTCRRLVSTPTTIGSTTTKLAHECCLAMFGGCTSLTTISSRLLPAMDLSYKTNTNNENGCYSLMFNGCTSLTAIPSGLLPATTLDYHCYEQMFARCTSLTTIPSDLLPSTTLANGCYQMMFLDCTSLTNVPSNLLNATIADISCYNNMFWGCTSLRNAPYLPATKLARACYQGMFRGCTSLTTAPELSVENLSASCYAEMFSGCTNLNYIKCLATNKSASWCTNNWVVGVSSSGTFIKASSMTGWARGDSGIPNNWTINNA